MRMDQDSAIARLSRMVAAETDPELDESALEELLALAKRPDFNGNLPSTATAADYEDATDYAAGTVVKVGSRYWQALSAGTSTGITFPVLSGPVGNDYLYDGTALVWHDIGAVWVPTWDLNYAAAEGWRWKAGLVANRFDFASDNQQFSRGQFMAHCLEMADRYSKRSAYTVTIEPSGYGADYNAALWVPAYQGA